MDVMRLATLWSRATPRPIFAAMPTTGTLAAPVTSHAATHQAEGSSAPAHIPALDGVRALAVIGVIASHSGLFNLGWLGVDVFFGLSGYLITGILMDARAVTSSGKAFFIPFYMRRALRILPLAWVVATLMAYIRGEWSGWPWYVGYLVNWLPTSPPPRDLGHYWSLAVEEQFYTVWPAVVFFAPRKQLVRISCWLIGIDMALRLGFSMAPPAFATRQFLDLATFGRADSLLVGTLLAQRQRNGGWGRETQWALPVAIACAIAMVCIRWAELHDFPFPATYNAKWPVIALGVGAFLLYVLVHPPAFLRWRWLAWIGKISYGVYVIHSCFGHWLHKNFQSPPLIFVLQMSITIPLAALSWYLFESPILRQKWRWPMPQRRPVAL
jgi:peptidoglycan/LPS O-acetylase OafA/YrhL